MPPKSKPSKSKKQTTTDIITQKQAPTPSIPSWPPLKPLIPASDLNLENIVSDQIVVVNNLFTSTLCKSLVAFLSTLPLVTTPGKPKKGDAVRVNDRFQIQDARFAESLWSGTALKHLVCREDATDDNHNDDEEDRPSWGGEVLGLNANIRIYRYRAGQFFAQHYDDTNNVDFTSPSSTSSIPGKTTWTLLIYLSSCGGGETVFYPDPTRSNPNPSPVAVAPATGMALFHRHGDKCMLHEGREVTQGEKWVLRSDLVVKRR